MNVFQINPLQDPRWQELVDWHPRASIFHTTHWLDAIRRTYDYRPVVFTTSAPTEQLRNGIVFFQIKSWLTGQRLVSLPFSDHADPLFESANEFYFVARYLQASADFPGSKYMELRPRLELFATGNETGFQPHERYYLHRVDISAPLDELFQSFDKPSVRRRVGRAETLGLTEKCGRSEQLLKEFYHLMGLTRVRHRLPPQPYLWFQNLIDSLGDSLAIRVAYSGKIPVAAILTLRFRDIAYYKYGCSDAKYNNLGATPFLLWMAICEAKSNGAKEFDLGRTDLDNQGLLTFKSHWTPNPETLVYWRYPGATSATTGNGWKLKLVKGVCGRLPQSLLEAAGRFLYRHIG